MMVTRLRYVITLAITLLFLASVAAAQGNYGGSMDAKEHGYQHGDRDGLRQGRADLNNNARPSFDNEDYRPADLGFEDYMGNRPDFQPGYRDGHKARDDDEYHNR